MADSEVVKDYTENFETWINDFNEWQTRIGFDPSWLGDYRFDIEDIKEAITPNSKSIFLIDPINPLGSTYPKNEKRAICEVAEDHDLWVIDDITYRDFAPEHTLAANLLPEKTITAYSVSKNCGLAGLRVGSLVGPKDFISDIRGTMVSDLGINVVGQRLSLIHI